MLLWLCLCFLFLTDWGGFAPHNGSASSRPILPQHSAFSDAFNKAWLPPSVLAVFFSSVFLGLVAFFFFSSGLVGFPLAVFSPPPCFLVLGGWVRDFCCLLHLASCILHLLFLASRGDLVIRPATPPAPTAPCLGACHLTRLLLGVVGGTRRDKGLWGDRGARGCDPAHCLGIMIVIYTCFFSSGAPHPLEPTLAFSPVLGLVWGVCFVSVCNHTT